MAGDDRGIGEHRSEVRRADRLTRLRTERLELGGERTVGGEQALDGHRRDHVGLLEEALDVGDGEAEHAENGVGAVGDGEPFLLGEFDRIQTRRQLSAVGGGADPTIMHDVAFAEQGEGSVCERGEVAAGAERSVLGHDRGDAGVEKVDHRLSDERPGTAVAERRACGPARTPWPARLLLRPGRPCRLRGSESGRAGVRVGGRGESRRWRVHRSRWRCRTWVRRRRVVRRSPGPRPSVRWRQPVSSTVRTRRATATTSLIVTPGPSRWMVMT